MSPSAHLCVIGSVLVIEDASIWLMINFGLDTKITNNAEQTVKYIVDLTKAVGVSKYKKESTELELCRRFKNRNITDSELHQLTEANINKV